MPIDRDPMCSKMIRVSDEVHNLLCQSKIIPQEPYNDCLQRILKENQTLKKIYFTTQTKERMEHDIRNFVLNPDVPSITSGHHREIWEANNKGETLGQDDLIHHINGNHDDNRPENLMKVSAAEHAKLHAAMNRADES